MNIDLFNLDNSVWEFTRKRGLLTFMKIVAAIVVFPGTFLVVFTIFWTLGEWSNHLLVVSALVSPLLLCFCVTLGRLFYDGYYGNESVPHDRPVLELLIPIVLFTVASLFAYVVAALSLLDGDPHTLSEWCHFFYLGSSPVNAIRSHSPIGLSGVFGPFVAGGLFFLLNVTVYTSVTTFIYHSIFRCTEKRAGTQMELWAYLLNPVFLWEEFTIKELARQMSANSNIELGHSKAGRSFQRKEFMEVGGYGYTLKQLWRYLHLPWVAVFRGFAAKTKPQVFRVYKNDGQWLIDDQEKKVSGPFLPKMRDMVEFATRHIPNAAQGVIFRFSDRDFFGAAIVLDYLSGGDDVLLYRWKIWGVEGKDDMKGEMLRELLTKKFPVPPSRIYVQAKAE